MPTNITHALVADGTPLIEDTDWNDPHVIVGTGGRSFDTAQEPTHGGTSFVDLGSPPISVTITTGPHRVLIGWTLAATTSANDGEVMIDVDIDGTRQGGSYGIVHGTVKTANYSVNLSGVYMSAPLSAGSHTFKLQGATDAGTGTFYDDSGDLSPACFWVLELDF